MADGTYWLSQGFKSLTHTKSHTNTINHIIREEGWSSVKDDGLLGCDVASGRNSLLCGGMYSLCLCGTAQIGPKHFVLRFSYHTQLDTRPVGLLWMTGQHLTEATTFTTRNKYKRPISMLSVGFIPCIPGIMWLQTCALNRMATRISSEDAATCDETQMPFAVECENYIVSPRCPDICLLTCHAWNVVEPSIKYILRASLNVWQSGW